MIWARERELRKIVAPCLPFKRVLFLHHCVRPVCSVRSRANCKNRSYVELFPKVQTMADNRGFTLHVPRAAPAQEVRSNNTQCRKKIRRMRIIIAFTTIVQLLDYKITTKAQ